MPEVYRRAVTPCGEGNDLLNKYRNYAMLIPGVPETEVLIYCEENRSAPVIEWLDGQPEKVQDKAIARVDLLHEQGHELRRPVADTLRNGVHELRIKHLRVNYRILYGFAGQRAVLLGGLTKERRVPDRHVDIAAERLERFKQDPEKHTYSEEQR